MKYAVSEDGVQALNGLSTKLSATTTQINSLTGTILNRIAEYQDVLGPHKKSIEEAVGEIATSTNVAAGSVESVAEILSDVAASYQEIIANDRIRQTTQSTNAHGGKESTKNGLNGGGVSPSSNGITQATSIGAISQWIKNINPHYGNPFFPQSSVNCGSCAFAVERRLSGDSTATATLVNIGTDAAMEQATGKKCTYMSVNQIEEHLRQKGAGSHLIVGINRRLPNGKPISGHWFNAFFDGEKIYTIEGQSGEILEWPHDYGYISEWCALI